MKGTENREILLPESRPDAHSFREDVLGGLLEEEKRIPCKYLYDHEGSILFQRICSLEEYYIPHAEKRIMQDHIEEIARHVGDHRVHLVEYGCGDCVKTRLLLGHLRGRTTYIPIDISLEQLQGAASDLVADYPDLEVVPVCADYTRDFHLPLSREAPGRVVVYFPGSTIGNFSPGEALGFLEGVARICGKGGGLLLGVDLKKEPGVLHRAYNDSEGVTAAFNLNLLERIRRELGWDIRADDFEHYAFYNPRHSRVEMHLVSLKEQEVDTGEGIIRFDAGESIWTESSYKYNLAEFRELAAAAGLRVVRTWSDENGWFSVQYLLSEGS